METRSAAIGFVDEDLKKGLFRVNRRAFTDPAVLVEERENIFAQTWLYVGHESEIPQPGNFVWRKVAGRPYIFQRDDLGQVRVLVDSCTHRGNSICREQSGTAKRFTCFYHGWTFNTRGELVSVPDRDGYSEAFDLKNYSLASPPRVESYRGMVFLSLKKDIVDLKTYLGYARDYLDLFLDYEEELEITPGQQSYSMRANWKLLVENSIDGYHGLITHQRYFIDYVRDIGGDPRSWQSLTKQMSENNGIALGNGHATIEYPLGNLPLSEKAEEHLAGVRARMEKRLGAGRTRRVLDISRNLFIFPNLVFVHHFRTVRTFYPVAPDYIEINAWALLPKGEPAEIRRLRHDNFISFLGPGGFGTPDDVEALENCQRGFAATELAWSDISRGMKRLAIPSDEVQMRAFWRRWYQSLNPAYTPAVEEFAHPPNPAAMKTA